MKTEKLADRSSSTLAGLALAAIAAGNAVAAAEIASVDELIEKIKSKDDRVRGAAWQSAEEVGPKAVPALGELMATSQETEVARAAKRGLWLLVRHAGRPKADEERKAVQAALLPLLKSSNPAAKREVLWMLSEIGDDQAVPPMAALLTDAELREDARQTLQRIPGPASLAALKKAFETAPEEFKYSLAHSLRARGQTVEGYPSQRLVPTRQTKVE